MNRIRKRRPPRLLLLALLLTSLLPAACAKQGPSSGASVSGSAITAASAASSESADDASAFATAAGTAGNATTAETSENATAAKTDETAPIAEDGAYTSKDDVALYIHTYGRLPSNFLTKKDAQARGWESSKGNLQTVAPGMSIGGDRFGNREGLLPDKKGRQYYECDIDYEGGRRNAKRIVFSDDGLIFYTDDHYASFEQLY